MRHEVVGGDASRCRLQGGSDIALGAYHAAGLLGGLRRPGIARDHRDAAERVESGGDRRSRDLDDLLDPRRKRGLGIEGFDLAAIGRGALDRGVFHPGQDGVDPVFRLPAHDGVEVDDRDRLADVAPGLRRLEPQLDMVVGRQRQVCRDLDEVTERELPAGRHVQYCMIARQIVLGVDVPDLGGGGSVSVRVTDGIYWLAAAVTGSVWPFLTGAEGNAVPWTAGRRL
jgi:hypothetical protein